jgi:hypothetical protein
MVPGIGVASRLLDPWLNHPKGGSHALEAEQSEYREI